MENKTRDSAGEKFVKPAPGLDRWLAAFKNTADGFRYGIREEAAIREELLLMCLGVPAAIWLAPSIPWLLAMISSLLLLIIVEALNTAIEITLDRVSLEMHPKTKAAKDLGSMSVFLALVLVLLVWAGALAMLLISQ